MSVWPLEQRGQAAGVLGDQLEVDLVQVGDARLPVALEALQLGGTARIERDELEGAGAHGCLLERVGGGVLGIDADVREALVQRGVRLLHADPHGGRADHRHLIDRAEAGRQEALEPDHPIEAEFDILGVEGGAVVELDAGAQGQLEGLGVGVAPLGGQPRLQGVGQVLEVGVDQGIEDVLPDRAPGGQLRVVRVDDLDLLGDRGDELAALGGCRGRGGLHALVPEQESGRRRRRWRRSRWPLSAARTG